MAVTRTIVVAGAGIGGLTAALALAKQRLSRRRSGKGRAAGGSRRRPAAFAQRQPHPGRTRSAAAARAARRDARIHQHHERARPAARSPACRSARPRIFAPARPIGWCIAPTCRRALQAQVNDNPDIELRLGCQFEDVTAHAKGLTVVHRRGNARQQELAVALIGADGIWSAVRHHLFPEVQPQFSGLIAWRGTLDATALPREYTSPRVQLWMGPDAHLVAYPISGGAADQCRRHRAGDLEQAGLERAGRGQRNQGGVARSTGRRPRGC